MFTVLDLKSAYWHIRIKEGDKEKTAFVQKMGNTIGMLFRSG